MTAQVTDKDKPNSKQKDWTRKRKELGDDVAKTVGSLQIRFLTENLRAPAAAALAKLRRGIGRKPGFDYTLDDYLAVPSKLLGHLPDDDASDAEHAKHAAVTLYALHQQSQRERMHVDRRGLGTAIAELFKTNDNADGIRRRFAALGTASTFPESLHHLRSLITILRDKQIPLDYGLLADDLLRLRHPDGRADIQAAWGREFFRGPLTKTSTANNNYESNNDLNEGINS